MEYKYTADGKKVRVVGELKSKEFIVQEIAIVNGKEVAIISNFTVKDLYDEPIITWKAKHLAELEAAYNEKVKSLAVMERDLAVKTLRIKTLLNYAEKVLDETNENTLDTLINFLSGNIRWVVVDDKYPAILDWTTCDLDKNKLKLITLFGNSSGELQYTVNIYESYYTQGSNLNIIPFTNYEDAFTTFKDLVLKTGISEHLITIANKYGIQLDADKVAKWKEKQLQVYLENIKLYDKEIIANNEAIDKLSNL